MEIGEIRTKKVGEIKLATEQYLANNNISNIAKQRQYFERQKEIQNSIGDLQ